MFALAFNELRRHPMRIFAPVVAILISLGFVSGVLIFMKTATNAIAQMSAPQTKKANITVNATVLDEKESEALTKVLSSTPGVSAIDDLTYTYNILKSSENTVFAQVYVVPAEGFRWSSLASGQWPADENQIALSEGLAKSLKVGVGATVKYNTQSLTVSGITDDPNALAGTALSYVTKTHAQKAGWANQGWYSVQTRPGADDQQVARELADRVREHFTSLSSAGVERKVKARTANEVRQDALKEQARSGQAMQGMLLGFAGIAVLIGMIIIANTFTILLAQRRRQIGLLRAIGATGSQVRRSFFAETMLIGLIGGVLGVVVGLGVAWVAVTLMRFDYWGMTVPWGNLVIVIALGVVITTVAAIVPSLRATRVAPLEALQPVATVEQRRKMGIVRVIVCTLLLAVGVFLVTQTLQAGKESLIFGIGAGFAITFGVFGLAPLFIPVLLRIVGVCLRPFGSTVRLAVANSVRNPSRSAATATALMLAIGIIVTLQVATASIAKTARQAIVEEKPLKVTMMTKSEIQTEKKQPELTKADLDYLARVRGVTKVITLKGAWGNVEQVGNQTNHRFLLSAWNEDIRTVAKVSTKAPADDEILLHTSEKEFFPEGRKLRVRVGDQSVELTVRLAKVVQSEQAMVSAMTLARLSSHTPVQFALADVDENTEIGHVYEDLNEFRKRDSNATLGGSLLQIAMVSKVLNVLLNVATGLLAAAVIVALVGVGNTLSLSVLERRREAALLRAMGMQRSSLRVMLLVEALLLGGAGVLVGVGAGSFFGWLGAAAAVRSMELKDTVVYLSVDWSRTAGLIGIAFAAAALASILPGRRAAMATPVEALAME